MRKHCERAALEKLLGEEHMTIRLAYDYCAATDAELLHGHIAGNRGAFNELARRHHKLMWRAIRQVGITNEDEGCDILQDALLKVHRHAHRWDGSAKVGTWIFALVRNTALTHIRAKSRRVEPGLIEFEERMKSVAAPVPREESTVMRLDLHRYVNAMASELKEVLVLTTLYGLSEVEVGERLGIPVGTVKSRKSRARRTLREIITADGGDLAPMVVAA